MANWPRFFSCRQLCGAGEREKTGKKFQLENVLGKHFFLVFMRNEKKTLVLPFFYFRASRGTGQGRPKFHKIRPTFFFLLLKTKDQENGRGVGGVGWFRIFIVRNSIDLRTYFEGGERCMKSRIFLFYESRTPFLRFFPFAERSSKKVSCCSNYS